MGIIFINPSILSSTCVINYKVTTISPSCVPSQKAITNGVLCGLAHTNGRSTPRPASYKKIRKARLTAQCISAKRFDGLLVRYIHII